MSKPKRNHPASFKVKVALAAIKETLTLSQLSSEFGVHSSQVRRWKQEAVELLNEGFSAKKERDRKEQEGLVDELYKQIGQLKVELDWLKKKSGWTGA